MDVMPLTIPLWQRLDEWDKAFFVKLNSEWTNPVFDLVLPWTREPLIWAPLYLFIFVFITVNFGVKGLWWSLLFICTVAITDVIGARVFKEGIERLRPCQDHEFANHVRLLLKHCSGSYSFVSNHAANHFALASFAFVTFRGLLKKWIWLAYAWALIIAYAQVYVGVHYPLDVLGGGMLGTLIGLGMAELYHKKWGTLNLDNQKK
jgi:undecaprenyl-diphosphatase